MSRPALMPTMFSLFTTATVLFGGGCSHEQKVTKIESPSQAGQEQPHARNQPPHPGPSPAIANASPARNRSKEDESIFFDFDSFLLRPEALTVLQTVGAEIRGKNKEQLRVEGNCDDIGTVEYNIALGDQRARAAKDYLVHLGVSPNRIQTVSYGSQKPRFAGHDDDTRARNRRDDFVLR